jgi:hypothetical protein
LFEHAFARYKDAEPVPEPTTRRPAPTSSFSSFIDDVSMADITVEDPSASLTATCKLIAFSAVANLMDLCFGGRYEYIYLSEGLTY